MQAIQDIYIKYKTPPPLIHHLYRVTAYALFLADHLVPNVQLNRDLITKACLFHDIGNIIKFDFRPNKLIEIPDQDVAKWKKVQEDFIAKYGPNENIAVNKIIAEIGLDENIQLLLKQTGMEKIKYALSSDNWNIKLIRIADEHISPQGVVTITQRYADVLERYQGRNHHLADKKESEERLELAIELEKQIQSQCTCNLQDVSNVDIEPYIDTLPNYKI